MARRTRVAILSDSGLFREALAFCLAAEDEFELVGQSSSIHDLLLRARGRSIDVLLVYPGVRPLRPLLEALWDVKTLMPASRVALLGCQSDHPEAARDSQVDHVACLGQDASYGSVLEAIGALSAGRGCAGNHQPKAARTAPDSLGARLGFMPSATPFPASRGRGRA